MDNISRIQQGLIKGEYASNPHSCAEDQAILAGEYAWIMGQLESILQKKPAVWNEMRKSVKSDTACERVWENTPYGVDEMGLRLRAKSVEKMMGALKTLVRLAESESHNLT